MAAPGVPAAEGVELTTGAKGRQRVWAQGRFWLTVVLVLAGLVFWARAGFALPPNTIAAGPLPLVLAMIAALAYGSVGLLLAMRRPEVRIGAIEAWIGVLIGGLSMAWAYLALAQTQGDAAGVAPYLALVAAVLVTPCVAALAVELVLLFPTDEFLFPSWRRVVWLAAAGAILAGLGRLLRPGPLTFVGDYENPIGVASLGSLPGLIQVSGYLLLGIAAVIAGACVVQRYLLGGAVERAQVRVFAALTGAGTFVFVLFVATFFIPTIDTRVRDAIVVLNILIASFGPIALTIAIARYRLWEIDHLVGRTFVYGALTAILAGVYAASLRLFQTVFVTVTGQDSDAALVITTLILATTFTPIKERLEKVVKRWRARPGGADAFAETEDSGVDEAASATPIAASTDPFADPAFTAKLDERIRAILLEGGAISGEAGPAHQSRGVERPGGRA
jgi:FtsH-binding integral membrane protein